MQYEHYFKTINYIACANNIFECNDIISDTISIVIDTKKQIDDDLNWPVYKIVKASVPINLEDSYFNLRLFDFIPQSQYYTITLTKQFEEPDSEFDDESIQEPLYNIQKDYHQSLLEELDGITDSQVHYFIPENQTYEFYLFLQQPVLQQEQQIQAIIANQQLQDNFNNQQLQAKETVEINLICQQVQPFAAKTF